MIEIRFDSSVAADPVCIHCNNDLSCCTLLAGLPLTSSAASPTRPVVPWSCGHFMYPIGRSKHFPFEAAIAKCTSLGWGPKSKGPPHLLSFQGFLVPVVLPHPSSSVVFSDYWAVVPAIFTSDLIFPLLVSRCLSFLSSFC